MEDKEGNASASDLTESNKMNEALIQSSSTALIESSSTVFKDTDMFDRPVSESMERDGMNSLKVWAYSVGHLMNDLCASMWFVYFTYYLIDVVQLPQWLGASAVTSG